MDINALLSISIGLIFLAGYCAFAYFVTHRGDFYHIRRWKASILSGIILGFIFMGSFSTKFFSFTDVKTFWNDLIANPIILLSPLSKIFIFTFDIGLPIVFLWTLISHNKLKWNLNSDDRLDRIWKDPNRRNKNPIREL